VELVTLGDRALERPDEDFVSQKENGGPRRNPVCVKTTQQRQGLDARNWLFWLDFPGRYCWCCEARVTSIQGLRNISPFKKAKSVLKEVASLCV
jgi:hypothetical protein